MVAAHCSGHRPVHTIEIMSTHYKAIYWNRQKKAYDKILWLGILLLLVVFVVGQLLFHPDTTIETMIIRATAFVAIVLLHLILVIGPLCRLRPVFLPLLYNRRHLGVSMFLLAAVHGIFCTIQFHALGDTNPIISIFTSNQHYASVSDFPFQVLGFFALVILFLMAATSHDFWLKNLSPRIWKTFHMGVYLAYGLIVLHIALGTMQYEDHPFYGVLLFVGFVSIAGLHLAAGWREYRALGQYQNSLRENGFRQICPVGEIPENRGKTVFVEGENIAIFKYDDHISAVNNICKHQMGPLGEGKVIDGCITCPWHGYQYHPENGQSPAPFDEKVTTYETRIANGHIWVNPSPKPEGCYVEPTKIPNT